MWVLCVFFFSSRRRHTRSLCDWSSDVCSSDLVGFSFAAIASVPAMSAIGGAFGWRWAFATMGVLLLLLAFAVLRWFPDARRSEERRVGKGGRSRGPRCRLASTWSSGIQPGREV